MGIKKTMDIHEYDPNTDLTGLEFTIGQVTKRRSFWQWLTREPMELQVYRVLSQSEHFIEYEEI